MKIYTSGARHWASQLPRIEAGFIELGHELVKDVTAADMVYMNNGPYERLSPNAKHIFTCLDVPSHLLPHFDLDGLRRGLGSADAVCSISKFVQWQVKHYLGMDSTVIYQPIKKVYKIAGLELDHHERQPLFAQVGRRFDTNKRYPLAVEALELLHISWTNLALVGSEAAYGGHWSGVMSDTDLNAVYNTVDFVFTLGKIEGLSLPTLESMAAGAIPIVCNDMTTRTEFLPPDLFPEYNDVEPNAKSIANFITRFTSDSQAMNDMKSRLYNHYQTNLARHFAAKAVAEKIIGVYNSLA